MCFKRRRKISRYIILCPQFTSLILNRVHSVLELFQKQNVPLPVNGFSEKIQSPGGFCYVSVLMFDINKICQCVSSEEAIFLNTVYSSSSDPLKQENFLPITHKEWEAGKQVGKLFFMYVIIQHLLLSLTLKTVLWMDKCLIVQQFRV